MTERTRSYWEKKLAEQGKRFRELGVGERMGLDGLRQYSLDYQQEAQHVDDKRGNLWERKFTEEQLRQIVRCNILEGLGQVGEMCGDYRIPTILALTHGLDPWSPSQRRPIPSQAKIAERLGGISQSRISDLRAEGIATMRDHPERFKWLMNALADVEDTPTLERLDCMGKLYRPLMEPITTDRIHSENTEVGR